MLLVGIGILLAILMSSVNDGRCRATSALLPGLFVFGEVVGALASAILTTGLGGARARRHRMSATANRSGPLLWLAWPACRA
ncbi:hypothetical protein AQJ67_22955 [Streptomyces caeruleatus]|uniref:Uncharacterized protein n=1 Tax=Streptomyces caeruleatus TaxID=661399 RepID=A0A117RPH0_9ACTN|nr:hypothetical protein AQJ67_22955 [Streptomyces caeruleatus]